MSFDFELFCLQVCNINIYITPTVVAFNECKYICVYMVLSINSVIYTLTSYKHDIIYIISTCLFCLINSAGNAL